MSAWIGCLIFVSLLFSNEVVAQKKGDLTDEQRAKEQQEELIYRMEHYSGNSKSQNSLNTGNLSFRNFVRGGLHSGNLIQVPFISNLNVSAGYYGGFVSPSRITWPRGSGVEYGHTMTFGLGAKVENDDGEELTIISESYNRGGGDSSPDGSHQYFFNPIPGFYNMYGDRSTQNRLNDNPDDRQRLEDAGYYFVGGLNEDAFVLQNEEGTANEYSFPLQNKIEYPAISHRPETWPEFWPPQTYPGDDRELDERRPGIRAGRWNGAFGSFVRGDQESYYVADDRDNDEFPYYPFLNPETGEPDTRSWSEGGKRGLGVEVTTRQYQWASILAEDIFVAVYDIKNISRKDIPEMNMFQIVDYDIGGNTSGNEAFFDTEENITYQWSKIPLVRNGFNVGYAAVGFLLSPGNDKDGIDNDRNGITDESQFDGIDNDGDWTPWEDVNGNGAFDPNIDRIWDDTGSDGLGPENEGYPGADPDGTEANGVPDVGEPNFEVTDNDEIDQIGLTNMVIRTPTDFNRDIQDDEVWYDEYIQPVPPSEFIIPSETDDIIYVYSSGSITLRKGDTERFAIAYLNGNNFDDILRNKTTMQNIYDADFNFAKPPNEPYLTASAVDGEVRLAWDNSAERSRDPIYGFDFEMYKVYKSTDPDFNDIKTITDAFGNPLLWEPIAQYDIINGLQGAHPVPIGDFGVTYDMGTDSGLEYSYVDTDVQNGRTYYYAVVSVDHGYAENFYDDEISELPNLTPISPTESGKVIEVDAFDNVISTDRNTSAVTPQPATAGYVPPGLENDRIERISGVATGRIEVSFMVPDSAKSDDEYEFTFTDDGQYQELDSLLLDHGKTTGFTLKNVTTGELLATEGENHEGADIFDIPALNARVYDGMKFKVENPISPEIAETGWMRNPDRINPPSMVLNVTADGSSNNKVPRDYEIRIKEMGADTSKSITSSGRKPVNYQIYDVTDPNEPYQVPLSLSEPGTTPFPQDTIPGQLTPGDVIDLRVGAIETPFGLTYSASTWRYTATVPEQTADELETIKENVSAMYDTLAAYEVRGLENRPFGGDLSGKDYIDFLDDISPWYSAVLDSMRNEPGLNAAIGDFLTPEEYTGRFNELYEIVMPVAGDRFLLTTEKPFNSSDVIRFKVTGNTMEEEPGEEILDDIHVAPDPYIVVNPLEPRARNIPGRGERRIDFRQLPKEATIKIFTMSGRLVKTLHHTGGEFSSTKTWDLKSDDGLNVSYGVYIYHVDAPGIGEKIGRFSLIK
ncbi:MAG: hypothetical protein GVY07_15545 [Bacteroidetes bacterium]|nr:hypothetical protein [Bacteroidota bacterium]